MGGSARIALRLKALKGDTIDVVSLKKKNYKPSKESFNPPSELQNRYGDILGPRTFVCTVSRSSINSPPPLLKRPTDGGGTEFVTQHHLLWEMLSRRNKMPGRYEGVRIAEDEAKIGCALPGTGPVIWAIKAHAIKCPVYGSLLACYTSGGYTRYREIDSIAKIIMTHEHDTLLFAATIPESFFCNPHHLVDFIQRFTIQRNVNKSGLQPRSISLEFFSPSKALISM